jgi:hypothetical protein
MGQCPRVDALTCLGTGEFDIVYFRFPILFATRIADHHSGVSHVEATIIADIPRLD